MAVCHPQVHRSRLRFLLRRDLRHGRHVLWLAAHRASGLP